MRLHHSPFLAGLSLSGPQLVGAPCEVASFVCPDTSLPLRSPEVSTPRSVVFFLCPDFLPLAVSPHWCPRSFHLNERLLAFLPHCVGLLPGLAMRWPFISAPPPAPPYTPGPNASDTATVASSAPPADPMPAGPLAMASTACTTGSAPLIHACQRLRV